VSETGDNSIFARGVGGFRDQTVECHARTVKEIYMYGRSNLRTRFDGYGMK